MKKTSFYVLSILVVLVFSTGTVWAIGKRGDGGKHASAGKAHHKPKNHPTGKKAAAVHHHEHEKHLRHPGHATTAAHHSHAVPHGPNNHKNHHKVTPWVPHRAATLKGPHPGHPNKVQPGPVRMVHHPHNALKHSNPAQLKGRAESVRLYARNNYKHVFTPQWWQTHHMTNARWYPRWWAHHHPYYWWKPCAWGAFAGWFGWTGWSAPVAYDYGNNIIYQDDVVYIDGKRKYSAVEYYQEVRRVATNLPQDISDQSEWMPLGVFALQRGKDADPHAILQLAVNKEGVLAGTFFNTATDKARPIQGMVDKQTQRAAWTVGQGKQAKMVMETGAYNLTQNQTEVLVHLGPEKARKWLMVRLSAPKEGAQQAKP